MVDFALNEEQKMMADMAHDFARTEIRPLADRYYRKGEKIPHAELDEVLKKANGLRLIDYYFPAEYGGLGITDKLITCLMVEELCWGDSGIAIHIVASGLCAKAIEAMGTPEQNKRWLERFCNPNNDPKMPHIGAFCLTEPGAGSNVTGMTTTARKDGDHWVLNGVKQFITNGGIADTYVVIAQTNPGAQSTAERVQGLAGFIVEKGTKGLKPGSDYIKWGVLATNTTEVHLEDVRIPAGNRLGSDTAGGMMGVVATLESSRVMVASAALGIARAAHETALAYAKTRVQKKPIIEFQAIGHKLADMETQISAARGLVWKAAWMATNNVPFTRGEGSQAKLYCGDLAVECCLEAIQIHGGYGFMKEYDVGRWLMDAIIFKIWEGTAEIQRNTIVRYLSQGGGSD
ncbi:MAG TPA: acyl-CoA dehydrogenase family protein [Planctomycetota bacterium]|nr:acyl-CoA dehydrogenase family protein [Planctomycetota bacterium]